MKKALITGISGQDGSYLTEYLLAKGYEVHGIIRRASTFNTHRLDHLYRDPHNGDKVQLYLHYGDIGSSGNLSDIIRDVAPDEIYHRSVELTTKPGGAEPHASQFRLARLHGRPFDRLRAGVTGLSSVRIANG